MRLSDLYAKLNVKQREELASKAGISSGYLYQIATRWRGKRATASVIQSLADADKRLKVKDMVQEFADPPSAVRNARS